MEAADPVVVESADGKKETIELSKFVELWVPYKESNYSMSDMHSVETHHGFQIIATKANIYTSMNALSRSIGKPSVRMQAKPFKKVFLEADYKKAWCVLVPETTNIIVIKPGTKPPSNGIPLEGDICPAVPKAMFFPAPPPMAVPKTDGAETKVDEATLNSAVWCVRSGTEEEVNMMRSTRKVRITVDAQIGGKVKACIVEINIPVLESCSELTTGDERAVLKQKVNADDAEEKGKGGYA